MKFYLTSIALLISCNCILAQITQYATIFFEDKTVETPNSRFFIGGVMAEDNFIKAKVKITNFTDKTLVVKPEECSYVIPSPFTSIVFDSWSLGAITIHLSFEKI